MAQGTSVPSWLVMSDFWVTSAATDLDLDGGLGPRWQRGHVHLHAAAARLPSQQQRELQLTLQPNQAVTYYLPKVQGLTCCSTSLTLQALGCGTQPTPHCCYPGMQG